MKLGFAGCAIVAAGLVLGGCAVASDEVDVNPTYGKGDAHGDGNNSTTDGGDDGSAEADFPDGGDDASSDSTSGTDGGDDGGSSETSTETGTPCSMLTSSDCASSATDLGSISGDTGSPSKTASGTDNQFLRIKLTEDDSSVFSAKDLHARFTLTSTPPQVFYLYVYEGPAKGDGGGVECTTYNGSAEDPSGNEVVEESWTDHHPLGGFDDTRIFSIEVRSATPTCTGGSWSLLVEGNK